MYMKGKALRKKKMSKNLKKTCSNVRYMKFVPYGMYKNHLRKCYQSAVIMCGDDM